MDLRTIAAALGGKIRGQWVYAPGPGHSSRDRSMAIRLDPNAPEGFRVHSFSGDDFRDCLDYARSKMGLPQWQPNECERVDISEWRSKTAPSPEGPSRVIATYNYRDASGVAIYRVCRTDPKDFYQERPNGVGWVRGVGDIKRVLYRLPDLLVHPGATTFICEGEKDCERLAALGHCATTVASGAWSGAWGVVDVSALAGCDVLILEDNDHEGRKKAIAAAEAVYSVASSVRVVRLPGLEDRGDVSDWLDATSEPDKLAEICFAAPLWVPKLPATPIDLWDTMTPPELPQGMLPQVIERFALEQGKLMGADPAGLAMSALAVCAAAIPDRIRLQVKVHEPGWREGARLWVALVGDPSTKKSPIMSAAARPLVRIDKEMQRKYAVARAEYDDLSKEEKKGRPPPAKTRLRIEDSTIEAAQDILRDSPDGVLNLQDEMSGWFGSMDKYAAGRGSAKDRGFWLSAFNGQSATVDRVGRGSIFIPCLSISLLGGIQPEPMKALMTEAVDDGLIQRLCPVMLRPAQTDLDEAIPPVVSDYSALIDRLHEGQIGGSRGDVTIHMSDEAQKIRRIYAEKHQSMMGFEKFCRKLASHFGKLDGIYARLCLIFHAVERAHSGLIEPISADIAHRVGIFLHSFMVPHAAAFYSTMGVADSDGSLQSMAGFILAHPEIDELSFRSVARAGRSLSKLDRPEALRVFQRLEAMGWVEEVPAPRPTSPSRWRVNPACRQLFAKRAVEETTNRHRLQELIRIHPGIVH